MPGVSHETVVQLLTEPPQLVASVLDNLGYRLPEAEPKLLDSSLSTLELRPDRLVMLGEGRDALVVVIEVQTAPPSGRKWRTWAAYQALAGREHGCQSLVLVIALRAETARRCRDGSPFVIGPGSWLGVAVIGPDDLAAGPPPGFDRARWGVLAVACGALDLDTPADRERALEAIAVAGEDDVERYSKLVMAMASEPAVVALEELMSTKYRETIIDRAVAEGRQKGEAIGRQQGEVIGRQQGASQSLLAVLGARGIDVPDDVRDAVLACDDDDELNAWVGRAATAGTLDDVFGERLSDWL